MINFYLKTYKDEIRGCKRAPITDIHYVELKEEAPYFWGFVDDKYAAKIEKGTCLLLAEIPDGLHQTIKANYEIVITDIKPMDGCIIVYFNISAIDKDLKGDLIFNIRKLYFQPDDFFRS